MGAQAGGLLSTPPDLMGNSGLGIPAFSGVPRPATWDATVSAEAPALTGDAAHFIALDDGTLIVDEDEPDGALTPLAETIEREIPCPYRAVAERSDGSVWTAGARRIRIAVLPASTRGELIELTVVGGERQLGIDGEAASLATPELDTLGSERSRDFALRAERIDDTTWEVDVSPL
jgi:hypothetical protein